MAPTDTNTKKEAKRHAGPLIGLAILVVLVVLGFFWWIGYAAKDPAERPAPPPETSAVTPPETPPAVPDAASNSPAAPPRQTPDTPAPANP
ncbi:hypothetical protein [Amaricoccus solimangrovi]|uniref:Uncharacterized protein n=1 Tax=Amaricoccus solimangrovi TaxID=2589815 RepID=A0A501WQV4_9RHOB|nr:hypothetical protein [Amaricoccus solimangrovi]TPE49361.1 hypothetical protein FJM51_14620 [Amaricoccus solimangrovi]